MSNPQYAYNQHDLKKVIGDFRSDLEKQPMSRSRLLVCLEIAKIKNNTVGDSS